MHRNILEPMRRFRCETPARGPQASAARAHPLTPDPTHVSASPPLSLVAFSALDRGVRLALFVIGHCLTLIL